jgi:hypothetical protein
VWNSVHTAERVCLTYLPWDGGQIRDESCWSRSWPCRYRPCFCSCPVGCACAEKWSKEMRSSGCSCVAGGRETFWCTNPYTPYNPYHGYWTLQNPLRILLGTAESKITDSVYWVLRADGGFPPGGVGRLCCLSLSSIPSAFGTYSDSSRTQLMRNLWTKWLL